MKNLKITFASSKDVNKVTFTTNRLAKLFPKQRRSLKAVKDGGLVLLVIKVGRAEHYLCGRSSRGGETFYGSLPSALFFTSPAADGSYTVEVLDIKVVRNEC
jgi:hypothetical protein